jgi:hypothetical protein|tara:strand:+ start:386 stop:784 length:399 start_codon:yes stop_codon:yes gene_type:complete
MAKDIQTFNRTNLQGLREEMNTILQSLEKKYSIKISTGNVSFLDNEATFKVKLNTIGDGGTVITKEATDWDRYKGLIGMAHLNIGDTIRIQGNRYTLSGYKRRASRRPIMFKDTRGQQFVCSEQMLSNENSK